GEAGNLETDVHVVPLSHRVSNIRCIDVIDITSYRALLVSTGRPASGADPLLPRRGGHAIGWATDSAGPAVPGLQTGAAYGRKGECAHGRRRHGGAGAGHLPGVAGGGREAVRRPYGTLVPGPRQALRDDQ